MKSSQLAHPTMQGLWDGFEGRGFAAWLPSFYDAVLHAASSEAQWCATALPDSHPRMLLQLLHALFSRIDKAFRTRLASALVQGSPHNLVSPLRQAAGVHAQCKALGCKLRLSCRRAHVRRVGTELITEHASEMSIDMKDKARRKHICTKK